MGGYLDLFNTLSVTCSALQDISCADLDTDLYPLRILKLS